MYDVKNYILIKTTYTDPKEYPTYPILLGWNWNINFKKCWSLALLYQSLACPVTSNTFLLIITLHLWDYVWLIIQVLLNVKWNFSFIALVLFFLTSSTSLETKFTQISSSLETKFTQISSSLEMLSSFRYQVH